MVQKSKISLSLIMLIVWVSTASWNLPYPMCISNDYTGYYSTDLQSYIISNPDLNKTKLKQGWEYFRQTFIMANGLVNNQTLNSGLISGATEGSSEGQGYGMLLALIMNDQTTFNLIFESANRILWSTEKKSYYCRTWSDGCIEQGAATGADLDIGLSLVFADILQKKGFWMPYNQDSVTYQSRAMEIIRTIRDSMCTSEGYLLVGDNPGSETAIDLKPSFFATAWLKVFNAYQKERDFTPVIDKCYEVIGKMPHYNKGQAADWVNTDGGQSTGGANKPYQGMGMQSEGIRALWRIAVDALWFNDTRAIAFCKNSKLTLTEYANSNSSYIIPQMGLYTDGAQYCSNTSTSGNIAMWACAILGSKNISYTGKGLNSKVYGRIIGATPSTQSFFGLNEEYGDYLNQAIAMLGFATIMGHFPDIYADMFDSECVPEGSVNMLASLSANKLSVDFTFKDTVTFTATLDFEKPWVFTLRGKTSGKTQTFTGNSASISVVWTGSGWYSIEAVEATLKVDGIDSLVPTEALSVTVNITGTGLPFGDPGGTMLLQDFENGSLNNEFGGPWYLYTDKSTNGNSTTEPVDAAELIQAGVGNPGSGIKVQFIIDQYAGVGTFFNKGDIVDLSNFESVVFDYKTEGSIDHLLFMLTTLNITNYAYNLKTISSSVDWKTDTILWTDLKPPAWSPNSIMDITQAQCIQWQVEGVGQSGVLYLDNIKLKLKDGMVPGEDIISLLTPIIKSKNSSRSSQNRFLIEQANRGVVIKSGSSFELFSLSGRRISPRDYSRNSGKVFVPLRTGQYIMVLDGKTGRETYKVIRADK